MLSYFIGTKIHIKKHIKVAKIGLGFRSHKSVISKFVFTVPTKWLDSNKHLMGDT